MTTKIIGSSGIEFPDSSGQGSAADAGPAFRAVGSGLQSIASGVYTKALFQVEFFDLGNTYDTTISSFQPTVAGYYSVSANVQYQGPAYAGAYAVTLYKNSISYEELYVTQSTGQYVHAASNTLVYMNGTTDYVEIYAIQNQGSSQSISAVSFSAFLARREAP